MVDALCDAPAIDAAAVVGAGPGVHARAAVDGLERPARFNADLRGFLAEEAPGNAGSASGGG